MMQRLSLYELNTLVQRVIEGALDQECWVEAELADVTERRGHLFLDLIQKGDTGIVARASAKCWASTWAPIRMHFQRVTRMTLAAGMKVLLRVYAQYHPAYGFSWIVTDVDPTYTVGDMARRRQEIIKQLKDEGIFDMQRILRLPMFCRRVAVISSATAAGYGDFCHQLEDNDRGFVFDVRLFPAIMQGEQVEATVINALNSIYADMDSYDCVVIIRGGGATSDMAGFDTLALAENVAQFPLPIITGIGHDRDECILDMVSCQRVKTPTAAAAFLIDHLAEVADVLDAASERVVRAVRGRLERERIRLTAVSSRLPVVFSLVKSTQTNRLDQLITRATTAISQRMQSERHRVEMLSQRAALLDPQLILQRGYSMTMSEGKIVSDASQLKEGDVIETRLANGTVTSKIWKRN